MASTSIEPRSYVDFEPRTEWFKGKESDTIIVDVSGFTKEQLKVLINTAGNLKIKGERPIEGSHWSRFLLSSTIPKNINLQGVQAKFDGDEGLLYVILPTSISTKDADSSKVISTEEKQVEKRGKISGEKTTEDYKWKGTVVSSVINKRKVVIFSVILGVMVSLGLAVYLSYRLKGL